MEKFGIRTLRQTKPILSDLGTYLTKVMMRVDIWFKSLLETSNTLESRTLDRTSVI